MISDVTCSVRSSGHEVLCSYERLACELSKFLAAELGEARGCVDAGSDSGSAHVDCIELLLVVFEVLDFLFQSIGKCLELLSKSHRNCILELGSSHLNDLVELLCLCLEGGYECLQALDEFLVHHHDGKMESCRVGVVG